MQLVILAAGFGRRFGGLKQLAPVGPEGQAIMDYTAHAAKSCGFAGVVIIVRDEIRDEIAAHIEKCWPKDLPVEYAIQGAVPGTAQAVASAAPYLHGPFGVANADDVYGEPALRALLRHFEAGPEGFSTPDRARGSHLLVAYHVLSTVLTDATVTRGLCEVDAMDNLVSIVEHQVSLREDGRFNAEPKVANLGLGPRILVGNEWVSMNLWGFYPSMLDHLATAVASFDPTKAGRRELLLPEVVGRVVREGLESVHVIETEERCIGVTHAEDVKILHDELTIVPDKKGAPRATGTRSPNLRGRNRH